MFVILGHRSLLKLNDEHFVLRALLVLLISKAVMFHPLQTTFLRDWILFIDDTVTNVILVILSRNFLSSFRALQWLFFVVRCCRVIDSRELIYIHVKRVSTLLQIYIFFFYHCQRFEIYLYFVQADRFSKALFVRAKQLS